ncbi:helix-turn-helix transcriptional regulator [Mobiluncus mulieris]|uniref:Helix-turn-helix transcriptional regulator n=1 Tax=Mobiluncus mulieris TaxID=2052 RepID=A0A7Y0U1N9_9ACTO|nr:helix-turn-helix transcriptional regulator [Mobiluncus mulieris]NMW64798.1 helix-turn-helix transcriptional regulator [Mobiluncus mulieris]
MTTTFAPDLKVSTADIVASNIRAEAARQGYSQRALGRALGLSQGQITTRWKGVARWQLDELDDVAALLGLSVHDLITPPRGGLGYEKNPSAKAPGLSDLVAGAGFEPTTSGL